MDDPGLLIEAMKIGGVPSALVILLWVFMQRWFTAVDRELKALKESFGKYKVRTEHRLTRVESKLDLTSPQEASDAN